MRGMGRGVEKGERGGWRGLDKSAAGCTQGPAAMRPRATSSRPGAPSPKHTLHRSQLDPSAQFALVVGSHVWVWAGSRAGAPPDTAAGKELAASLGLPDGCEVEGVRDRLEPGIFCAHFADWRQAEFAAFQVGGCWGGAQGYHLRLTCG